MVRERLSKGATHGRLYLHEGILGTTRALTDSSGVVKERYEYSPFGLVSVFDASFNSPPGHSAPALESQFDNPYLFLGRRRDGTGYDWFRDRYYDPMEGRFLTRDNGSDPLNLGNLYTWASNNPMSYIDPWGKSGAPITGASLWKAAKKYGGAFLRGAAKGAINRFWDMFKIPDIPSPSELWDMVKGAL